MKRLALYYRVWNGSLLNDVYKNLLSELSFQPDIEGGTISYRLCLCLSFFFKFYLKVQMELGLIQTNEKSALKVKNEKEGAIERERERVKWFYIFFN